MNVPRNYVHYVNDKSAFEAIPPGTKRDNTGVDRRAFIRNALIAASAVTVAGKAVAYADDLGTNPNEPVGDIPQWAMVIDLARCDGCGECTEACQETHFTGDQEWMKVLEVTDEAGNTVFLPTPCMHCENAPCLNVCPVGATFRNEHGTVLIDHDRCIGCRFCIAACPYDARSFNWDEPENPPGAALARYSPEFPVPHRKGTVDKCMLCAHDTTSGKIPQCASSCPMSAIWFGDLHADVATNGLETVQLSWMLANRNAFRLKEELGTRPRVWYLPGHGEHSKVVLPE